MSEAEDVKLAAAKADEAERKDAARKDQDEEIPAWADSLMKSHKSVMDRLDAMDAKKDERKDAEAADCKADAEKDEGEDPTEDTDGKKKDAKADAAEDKSEEKKEAKADAEEKSKEREDRARKDSANAAENRKLAAQIAELQHQVKNVYSEPSIEDRNALADARSRADSVFQAALGRPVPEPIPGEKPIAYRKRLADGLKKFSAQFKDERLDSLTGSVYEAIETHIYADALAAVKTPAVMPSGQLRAIKRRDLGHDITEYVGDPTAAWGPFSWGAGGTVKLNRASSN